MTKFQFGVEEHEDGCHISVMRLEDKAFKKFFIAGHSSTAGRISEFMCSLTDELTEGFFPKPRKVK